MIVVYKDSVTNRFHVCLGLKATINIKKTILETFCFIFDLDNLLDDLSKIEVQGFHDTKATVSLCA